MMQFLPKNRQPKLLKRNWRVNLSRLLMNGSINSLQCRLYLEAAKFHYKQMARNIHDRNVFIFYLLAFLPIARSITLVFKKEFYSNKRLMRWYQTKEETWKENKVMKIFKDMRNICLKEHAPIMLVRELVPFNVLLHNLTGYNTKEMQDSGVELISYVFELKEQIDKNPEVMNLCREYLDELEEFVIEAENMVRRGIKRHE